MRKLNVLRLTKIKKGHIFYFSAIKQNKPSSSKELDISLMCGIIQNLDYITEPKQGRREKPEKNDITMADDVERIRFHRNSFCHATSIEMDTDDFNDTALELIGVNCNTL